MLLEEATATITELPENSSQEVNTEAEVLPEESIEAEEANSEALEKPDPLIKTAATTENTDPSFADTEEEVVANVVTSEVVVAVSLSLEANTEGAATEVTSEEEEAGVTSFQEENIEEGASTGDAAEEAIQKNLIKADTKSNRELEVAEEAIQKAMNLPRTSELRAQRVQYLKLIW